MQPESLADLPLYKHHYTHGHRRTLADYVDAGACVGE